MFCIHNYCRLFFFFFFFKVVFRGRICLEFKYPLVDFIRKNPKTTVHILYMETWKVPPSSQNNDTPIHEAVWIWYTASTTFWIFSCMKHVSSENLFLQWKHCQELCLKIKLILEYVNFSFPNMTKRKIWTMLNICIAIIGEYCFRG